MELDVSLAESNTISDETVPSLMSKYYPDQTLRPREHRPRFAITAITAITAGRKRGKLLLASVELLFSTSQRGVWMLGRDDDFYVGPASMTLKLRVIRAVCPGRAHTTHLVQC
jgi:hypothetical protein